MRFQNSWTILARHEAMLEDLGAFWMNLKWLNEGLAQDAGSQICINTVLEADGNPSWVRFRVSWEILVVS